MNALVVVEVDHTRTKNRVALEDGVRESIQSWREVLLGFKSRGVTGPPLAMGDAALGFSEAISRVFGATFHQRCSSHICGNIHHYLSNSVQSKPRGDLRAIKPLIVICSFGEQSKPRETEKRFVLHHHGHD